jgi:beta-lactam-binding protein with PASTA domain
MLITGLAAAGAAIVVIAIIASSGGFGHGSAHVVPDLRGQRLDLAEARVDAIGLDSDTRGGGTFGIVIRSHWRVCAQEPLPGRTARDVLLIVDRECQWDVPDVTDQTLRQAEEAFARRGTPYVVDYPGGKPPRPGTHLEVCVEYPEYGSTSTPVELHVNRICSLDDLTDMTLARAVKQLARNDVELTAFTDSGNRVWKPAGWRVCGQEPGPNEPAGKVKVTVNRTCSLPDVSGMALDRALHTLRPTGVTARAITNTGQPVASSAVWRVCEEKPEGGAAADHVTLTVDRHCPAVDLVPPDYQILPYVEGYSLDYAEAALGAIGVEPTLVISRTSKDLDASLLEVCRQDPEAGERLRTGDQSVLYIAGDCSTEWPGGFGK